MAKNMNLNLNATVCIPIILIILLGVVLFIQMNKNEKYRGGSGRLGGAMFGSLPKHGDFTKTKRGLERRHHKRLPPSHQFALNVILHAVDHIKRCQDRKMDSNTCMEEARMMSWYDPFNTIMENRDTRRLYTEVSQNRGVRGTI